MSADDTGTRHDSRMEFDSKLLQWQKLFEAALHSDRMTGDIGVFVLKIFLVINGGALIALMAAFQPLAENKEIAADLTSSGMQFLVGLSCAVLAAAVSYFYQTLLTLSKWDQMQAEFGGEPSMPKASMVSKIIMYVGVLPLCLGSFVAFLLGALSILDAMRALTIL